MRELTKEEIANIQKEMQEIHRTDRESVQSAVKVQAQEHLIAYGFIVHAINDPKWEGPVPSLEQAILQARTEIAKTATPAAQ